MPWSEKMQTPEKNLKDLQRTYLKTILQEMQKTVFLKTHSKCKHSPCYRGSSHNTYSGGQEKISRCNVKL